MHRGRRRQSLHSCPLAFSRRFLFRVVGYLPGTPAQVTIIPDLRAGVAQASGEETAENASRSQHRARAPPADGPKRIDIQDKWWRMALLMMEVAPEWPARSSNFAR